MALGWIYDGGRQYGSSGGEGRRVDREPWQATEWSGQRGAWVYMYSLKILPRWPLKGLSRNFPSNRVSTHNERSRVDEL